MTTITLQCHVYQSKTYTPTDKPSYTLLSFKAEKLGLYRRNHNGEGIYQNEFRRIRNHLRVFGQRCQ